MNYKRYWNESRGDKYDHWGTSNWYFEIDEGGYPVRQIEKYEIGKILKYDLENMEDEYGGLGDQAFDLEEYAKFEITQEEFKKEWNKPT